MTREQNIEQHLRYGVAELKNLEAEYVRFWAADEYERALVELPRIAREIATKRTALRRAITAAAEDLGRIAQSDADRRLATV